MKYAFHKYVSLYLHMVVRRPLHGTNDKKKKKKKSPTP